MSSSLVSAVLTFALVSSPAHPADRPPPDDIVAERDPVEGLICYWGCMALCVFAGHRQDQCDDACTEMCFKIVTPPADCDPNPDRACA